MSDQANDKQEKSKKQTTEKENDKKELMKENAIDSKYIKRMSDQANVRNRERDKKANDRKRS